MTLMPQTPPRLLSRAKFLPLLLLLLLTIAALAAAESSAQEGSRKGNTEGPTASSLPPERTECPEPGGFIAPEPLDCLRDTGYGPGFTGRYHLIYGTVQIHGETAPARTLVTAVADSRDEQGRIIPAGDTVPADASTYTNGLGEYTLRVNEPVGQNFHHRPINFIVEGHRSPGSLLWTAGGVSRQDLQGATGPMPPHRFIGTVVIGGSRGDPPGGEAVPEYALEGITVHAIIDGEVAGKDYTGPGGTLDIEVNRPYPSNGAVITFLFNGARAYIDTHDQILGDEIDPGDYTMHDFDYPVFSGGHYAPLRHGAVWESMLWILPHPTQMDPDSGYPPHVFAGVAMNGDMPAPEGTEISGRIDNHNAGVTRVEEGGNFLLTIPYTGNRAHIGGPVYFEIGGRPADKSAIWQSGKMEVVELNTLQQEIEARFADLIQRDVLVTVFSEGERGTWVYFSPQEEWRELNTLKWVYPGMKVWAVVTRSVWFENQILRQGENVLILE